MPANLMLTEKELLYASMLLGIDNIWGVNDPYAEMAEEAIRMDILRIQKALLEKRYALSEEDGSFSLSGNVVETLQMCVHSKYLYEYSSDELERNNQILRYFVGENTIIRFGFNGISSLSTVSLSEMRSEITAHFSSETGDAWLDSLTAGTTRLKNLGSISRNHVIQELKEKGCDNSLSVMITNGLQGNASFRVLLCFDTSVHEISSPIEKLVTMHFPGGNLIAKSDPETVSDSVRLCKLSQEQLLYEIEKITNRVPVKDGDEYAS